MIYLEIWRCSACPRILGENVRMGDESLVRAVCWGCGHVNIVPEPIIPAEISEAVIERGLTPTIDVRPRRGKVKEAG